MTEALAPVLSRSLAPAAKGLALLTVEASPEALAQHTRAGQFCTLQAGEHRSLYALVDAPGASSLRFLLRDDGALHSALAAGEALRASAPQGPGFPLERARDRDVLLVSAGTGLGPLRAVLHALLAGPVGRVWLYHGTYNAAHLPFAQEWDALGERGVTVRPVYSDEPLEHPGVQWVQHALLHDRPALRPDAVVYAAAMKGLIDAVREALPALGLSPERLYLNY